MIKRWLFSKFFRDPERDLLIPVCSAYGARWFCPRFPADDDGWALVKMLIAPQQIEAAAADPRIQMCPSEMSPTLPPDEVIQTYASMGATAGMKMGELVAVLGESEPLFLSEIGA